MKQIVQYTTPHFLIDSGGDIVPLLGLLVSDEYVEGSEEKYHTYPVTTSGFVYENSDINGGVGDIAVSYLRRGSMDYHKCMDYSINIEGNVEDAAGFENYCKAIGLPIVNF